MAHGNRLSKVLYYLGVVGWFALAFSAFCLGLPVARDRFIDVVLPLYPGAWFILYCAATIIEGEVWRPGYVSISRVNQPKHYWTLTIVILAFGIILAGIGTFNLLLRP